MVKAEIQNIKLRFGIIGNAQGLNRAIDIAMQVAPTDLSVLITGESGVGKENFPQIIHQFSRRKHGHYIAVNCGAIPEGTIDSELFGHEKGSFTGAIGDRNGYFAEANGGTIFLDEVGELPLSTQARLLRVLETGEFIRVGSSKVLKTDVRVIAATNVNLRHAVAKGKFREDLYYRLDAVTIMMPSLRERPTDINLLFRKFASDFSEKYGMAKITLTEEASIMLRKYRWPGNIRQLKNVAEKVSVLESERLSAGMDKRTIDVEVLSKYIPREEPEMLPAITSSYHDSPEAANEREAIIRTLFQLKQDVDYLKDVIAQAGLGKQTSAPALAPPPSLESAAGWKNSDPVQGEYVEDPEEQDYEEQMPEELSIRSVSMDLIDKVLRKHGGNRKAAAAELGISERTLYRKLKQMN